MNSVLNRSSAFGIGKEIGGSIYVHQLYEHLFGELVVRARMHLPAGWQYTVVKWNRRSGAITFVHSPDWNENPEPTVGDLWTVSADGCATFRARTADPCIYHHKWLFVADDYSGFNVEESRGRSREWAAFPDVDRSRIGKQSYWTKYVTPRLNSSLALSSTPAT